MAKRKKKISDRLEAIKEMQDQLSEDKELLSQSVEFDAMEQMMSGDEDNEDKTEFVPINEISFKVSDEPVSIPDLAGTEEDKTIVTSSSDQGEGPTLVVADDSTHRDIQVPSVSIPIQEEKVSYGDVYENHASPDVSVESVDSILRQSEQLRIAQEKINDLEYEIEEIRRENDELVTAAETFKNLSEGYYSELEKIKSEVADIRKMSEQEVSILKESLSSRDKQLKVLKQENTELKSKVEMNFKHIRKRERDLEYRLELAKVEETALLKTKDKSILELRRKMDKLMQETDVYREKSKEHYRQLQEQQQTVRSVIRALRIALTRLEGDFGVDLEMFKKAE